MFIRTIVAAVFVLAANSVQAQFFVNGGNATAQLMTMGTGPGAASGGPPFVPSNLSGLTVWLNADSGVIKSGGGAAGNGDNVGTWTNLANGSANCTASANFPTYVTNTVNGHAAVRFSTAAGGVTCPVGLVSTPYTVIVARNHTSAAGSFESLVAEASGATTSFAGFGSDSSTPPRWYYGATGVSNNNTNLSEPVGAWAITSTWGLGRNAHNELGGTSLMGFYKVNGTLSNPITQTLTSNTANNIWVGSSLGGTSATFGGDMAEFLLFNRYLSDYEVFQVERYLATKYAIGAWTARPAYTAETFDGWVTQGIAIAPGPNAWDNGGVNGASFAFVNGTYYAVYTGQAVGTPANNQIGCASGASLSALTKSGTTPCLTPTPATWDSGYISGSRLFIDPVSGNAYVYYFGGTGGTFEASPSSIGVAQVNLTNWTMTKFVGNPILTPTAATWDSVQLYKPWVYYNASNATYYLFYNASNGTIEQNGYATASSPTGPFTKCVCNPIMSDQIMTGRAPSGFTRQGNPEVIQPNPAVNYWVMFSLGFVTGSNGVCSCTWLSSSTDLLTWTPTRQVSTASYMRFPQAASPGTFPVINLGGMDPHLVNGQWMSLTDDDRVTQGTTGSIYWQTLVHDP